MTGQSEQMIGVTWVDRGWPSPVAANPGYPDGIDLDSGERPACLVELPYMTVGRVGYWSVECATCEAVALVSIAGRADDAKSVMLPCKVEDRA